MTINLQPEHERLVAEAMKTGAYANPEEVIARALEMLHDEGEWLQDNGQLIREKIEKAFIQFESGNFFTAEESRSNMEKRKAQWLAERSR